MNPNFVAAVPNGEELPEGNWYCPQCRCLICGDAVDDKETSQLHGSIECSQCEHKYHKTCMQREDMEVDFASGTWFCGDICHKVYIALQSRVGLKNLISDGFSWTLLRCISGDQKVHSAEHVVALKAECNSKLAVAITILEECFLPMVDTKTGIDMIPQVMYNWGSEFAFRSPVLKVSTREIVCRTEPEATLTPCKMNSSEQVGE